MATCTLRDECYRALIIILYACVYLYSGTELAWSTEQTKSSQEDILVATELDCFSGIVVVAPPTSLSCHSNTQEHTYNCNQQISGIMYNYCSYNARMRFESQNKHFRLIVIMKDIHEAAIRCSSFISKK